MRLSMNLCDYPKRYDQQKPCGVLFSSEMYSFIKLHGHILNHISYMDYLYFGVPHPCIFQSRMLPVWLASWKVDMNQKGNQQAVWSF